MCQESTTMSTACTEMFQNLQSVNKSMWGKSDRYINIGLATSSQTVILLLFETGITPSRKRIYFRFSLLLKSLASVKHAALSFQPFTTHANTYIHSETHTLPTHMHTNPTPVHTDPLWSHKTETTSRSKNTQGTRNSLLNQSNRCASRRTHSLSRALKAHLDATNMFYDKWMKNMHTQRALHCIALEGQASKCRYRITRIDASVFPLWTWKSNEGPLSGCTHTENLFWGR